MAELLLGPLLRYAGPRCATVWVETDRACEVDVLGRRDRTFEVSGHHYALVLVDGLEPGTTTPYTVVLDGHEVWPLPRETRPPSVIRTPAPGDAQTLVFGSCRVCAPNEPPYTLGAGEAEEGMEVDALRAYAQRMAGQPPHEWPDALLLLGDQIYADEVSPQTRAFIRSRRDTAQPPGEEIADFEEYCRLYRESWSEPWVRWLLSTVPSAMIFDDHDVIDDWNISHAWLTEQRAQGWWDERITGAFMTYWIYQHVGNLAPDQLAEHATWDAVRAAGGDAGPVLREYAIAADHDRESVRWSFARDLGSARLVVIDSRAGRVIDGDHDRLMVDDTEWAWIREQAAGDHEHLLLATSVPFLLHPGLHWLEAFSERLCAGAWGKRLARRAETLRQAYDLEHWAAFNASFRRFRDLVREVGRGEHGPPPATIVALSGDVHHAYLAELAMPAGTGMHSRAYQAVCSPFRNPLSPKEQRAMRTVASRFGYVVAHALGRLAGAPDPGVRWRLTHKRPFFDNQVATLRVDGRGAELAIELADPHDVGEHTALSPSLRQRLA